MKSTFLVKTEKSNSYLIDIENKNILLIHPFLSNMIQDKSMSKAQPSKDDVIYYKNKFQYYIKHKLINNDAITKEMLFLNKDIINDSISNIKQVVFETTEKCNLECKYCFYGSYYSNNKKNKYINMPKIYTHNLLKYICSNQASIYNKSYNNTLFISFYGGEPLMNSSLIKDVISKDFNKLLKSRKFKYSITTNGTLLNNHIRFLKQNKIHITVSLDGDELCNCYRTFKNGENSYKIVFSNLLSIKNMHPEYFKKYIHFNAVLHNKNSVQLILNYFNDTFQKTPNILELNNSGIRNEMLKEFSATYQNKIDSLMSSSDYRKIESKLFINLPSYKDAYIFLQQYLKYTYNTYEHLLSNEDSITPITTGTCIPFSRKMFVTANGKILPCEKISQEYELGFVDNNGVHIDTESIANRYNIYYKKMHKQCTICYRNTTCNQCIFQINNLNNNPICNGFMDENLFINYLSNNMNFWENHSSDYFRIMNNVLIY
jgi:uncharacterized protein